MDKKPGASEYIGGMQDNGTWQSPPGEEAQADSDWLFRIGGDGYETAWHYENPDWIIGGSQFNGLRRSTDGGETWVSFADQIDSGGGSAPFVTKIAKSNSDPDLVFAVGASGVWRSDNFGETWTLSPINSQWGWTSLTQIEINYVNPQIVWAAAQMGSAGRPHVSMDGGLSFSPTNLYTEATLGRVAGLATHPIDENTAYLTFSFADAPKILRTTDLGETWEDISGFGPNPDSDNGFPDVATYCVLVMPHDPNIIWAGTEIGLFESTDNGETWQYADNGLPAVSIWQINITDDQVVLATHGLGIWTVTIPELPPPPTVTRSPRLNAMVQGPDGFLKLDIHLRSPYDQTFVTLNGGLYTILPANSAPYDTILNVPVTEPMEVSGQLTAFVGDDTFLSGSLTASVAPLGDPQDGYASNFNTPNSDFTGEGFMITTPFGFEDGAIHSFHPYFNYVDWTYMLKTPIIVADNEALVQFDEIAIIEPGEPGSEFGESGFYDYVIVEATSDGIHWEPLLDGYDARSDPAWLDAYPNNNINPDLYRPRTIDLHDTFDAGEVILLRFRLNSDPGVTAWGWAIDNLSIQQALGVEDEVVATPAAFRLSQNYPNPFNPRTTISFAVPHTARVNLTVYDVTGRVVDAVVDREFEPGNYEVTWNADRHASGIYFFRLHSDSFDETRQMILLK